MRLNFQVSPERLVRLKDEKAFQNLAVSRKKNPDVKAQEEAAGRAEQEALRRMLADLPDTLFLDRKPFVAELNKVAKAHGMKLGAALKKAILNTLSEQDETAAICRDKKGNPEADSGLRDTERVPLSEPVEDFFVREVLPHVPDAWIDTGKRDEKDGEVGLVGYEINFNRYFYTYTPPRPLGEIEADIREVELEILRLLSEVTGSNPV